MGNIRNTAKILTGTTLLVLAIAAVLPSNAGAWKVNHSADSTCIDSSAAVTWSFKNTEPNQAKWSIDLEVTDTQTGGKTVKTVQPGERVSGTFTSNATKLSNGKVSFKMLWTDGRNGIDTRTSTYGATDECITYVEPAFDANVICSIVDEEAVFTLNVAQTTGDDTLIFTPANGTELANGDPVTITGTYTRNDVEMKKTVTVDATNDCTPEEEKISVCRDGKVVTIAKDDKKDTDKSAPCEVKGVVTELPKTGISSLLPIVALTFVSATAVAQIKMRR